MRRPSTDCERLYTMYIDKLDGRIDAAFYDKLSADCLEDLDRRMREIELHQSADHSYLEEGIGLLELACNAHRLFDKQELVEKRRLSISWFRTLHG